MKSNHPVGNKAPTPSTSPILSQIKQAQTTRSASTHKTSPLPSSSSKASPQQHKASSLKSVPLKSLNQSITSRLTVPAGARPSLGGGERPLPSNYQSVARRVTMTIVALPILLVTSWVLWDRLVLGEQRKSLIREPPIVPGPPMAVEMEAARRNGKE
ncbi:hypothetical protein MFRU_005g01390 [Monilinia fructicola]|uniref:Uncharacterized protein n=1 Tax=Monilinia fructicola TaxID=38448 RepID=A0A5M9JQA6_MONFR|nr:hypothetical protein EYC84_002320 [Monilinia fructicola]KAG4033122.1 hypothetical protein MFRU_005g01390 [Monilinia fructicola]